MTRAPLVGGDVTFVDEVQHVPRLQANILHSLVTSDLIRHAAQRFRKFRFQSVALVSRPEILERVVKGLLHLDHVRIIRIHQGQFLFVHEYTGGNRRRQVVALIHQFG